MIDRKLEEILKDIKNVRDKMHNTINQEEDLLSPKVIHLSEVLDKLLNEYHRIRGDTDSNDK